MMPDLQTIWLDPQDPSTVWIIDQRALPRELVHEPLKTTAQAAAAIKEMHVTIEIAAIRRAIMEACREDASLIRLLKRLFDGGFSTDGVDVVTTKSMVIIQHQIQR